MFIRGEIQSIREGCNIYERTKKQIKLVDKINAINHKFKLNYI